MGIFVGLGQSPEATHWVAQRSLSACEQFVCPGLCFEIRHFNILKFTIFVILGYFRGITKPPLFFAFSYAMLAFPRKFAKALPVHVFQALSVKKGGHRLV
jgi:hypothetical protein